MRLRWLFASLLAAASCPAADQPLAISSEAKAVLAQIRPDSLKGHVSFLASDLLEGRGTPSRGQDLAAEYIASQFRRAGLEPAGDNGYFQTARFVTFEDNRQGLRFEVTGLGPIAPEKLTLQNITAISLKDAEAVKFGPDGDLTGKVVIVYAKDFATMMRARQRMNQQKPALVVFTGPAVRSAPSRRNLSPADARPNTASAVAIADDKFAAEVEKAEAGSLPFRITAEIAAPVEKPVTLRNVAAILRGSDPALKDTYEMVTAHYDHLGIKKDGEGDLIYNGANDDASGTASVLEIAAALATMQPHPRRSIVFVTFFGEEMGLLGSRYYGAHPLVPLAKTVADVNLEHMGRTDSDLGPHIGMVNFTGFDFSDVTATFKRAGEATDIRVVKDEANSDPFFARSDNQAMADMGVPAHTISVSYEFPDYHKVSDEWPKVDYDNMARVDRMVALGLLAIADNPQAPRWNEAAPKAKKYVEAGKKLTQ